MRLAVRHSGADKPAVGFHVRTGGVTGTVLLASIRRGGALHRFFGAYSVSLNRDFIIGRGNSGGTITVESNTVTASAEGAIGTLTYLWTRTDSDPQSWTINSPNAATTTFSTSCDPNTEHEATFHCTVTDQAGQTLASEDVTVSCANTFFGGIGGGGREYS